MSNQKFAVYGEQNHKHWTKVKKLTDYMSPSFRIALDDRQEQIFSFNGCCC